MLGVDFIAALTAAESVKTLSPKNCSVCSARSAASWCPAPQASRMTMGTNPKHTFKSIPSGMTSDSNSYIIGNLPEAVSWANPALPSAALPDGISDWVRSPRPWSVVIASVGLAHGPLMSPSARPFPIHEQINLEFRAEGFNILNHHNLFIQQGLNDVANVGAGVPVPITASKGGIGSNNGANDERRFGQFALKFNF